MKLFILVRADLDPSYRMVQGMHAVAEIGMGSGLTFVCLLVKDVRELVKWEVKLKDEPFFMFREPDLQHEPTALACYTNNDSLFSKLRLA